MSDDPFDLRRFVVAQEHVYARALAELREGEKRTHWMWFVFPQLVGLGRSTTAITYSIHGLDEARAYLQHPVLGPRLIECAEAVLGTTGRSARDIFAHDDVKLHSSATLFAAVAPAGSVFEQLLHRFFHGSRDARTLQLLGIASG